MLSRTPVSIALSLALLGFGCGDYSNRDLVEDLAFLRAIPARSALEIRVAETGSRDVGESTAALGQRRDPLIGDPATYYLFSHSISSQINASIFGFLDIVDLLTQQVPPSLRAEDRRVWGPWPSEDMADTDVRFSMICYESSSFGLFFQVRDGSRRDLYGFDEGWRDCFFGQVEPASQGLRRGVGNLTIDLDACSSFSGSGESGLASVGFDTRPDADNPDGKTELQIWFSDFLTRDEIEAHGEEAEPLTALYVYLERRDVREFDFLAWADLNEDRPELDRLEQVALEVRWTVQGQGRADASISGGDLEGQVISLVECWDEEHARNYYTDSHGLAPTEGELESCPIFE